MGSAAGGGGGGGDETLMLPALRPEAAHQLSVPAVSVGVQAASGEGSGGEEGEASAAEGDGGAAEMAAEEKEQDQEEEEVSGTERVSLLESADDTAERVRATAASAVEHAKEASQTVWRAEAVARAFRAVLDILMTACNLIAMCFGRGPRCEPAACVSNTVCLESHVAPWPDPQPRGTRSPNVDVWRQPGRNALRRHSRITGACCDGRKLHLSGSRSKEAPSPNHHIRGFPAAQAEALMHRRRLLPRRAGKPRGRASASAPASRRSRRGWKRTASRIMT